MSRVSDDDSANQNERVSVERERIFRCDWRIKAGFFALKPAFSQSDRE